MRLLVVEDEEKLAQLVKRSLAAERFSVDVAHDGRTGLQLATDYDYDLIILDLLLPALDGTELLRRVRRSRPSVPVLILTARDAVADKVTHFEAGADDCLTKPFAMAELLVRVKSLLRRTTGTRENVLRVADLELDRLTQQVRRAGRRIDLTAKEYGLLEYLMANSDRVLSRSMILDHVWDQGFQGATNIVDVYVRHLRDKISDMEQKLIRTDPDSPRRRLCDIRRGSRMKTRSIRFRLTAWYAGLLGALLVLFGIFIYFTLDRFLEAGLRDTLAKEAQTIGETLLHDVVQNGEDYVVGEIEEHFAPRIMGRFVRVTRPDGTVLYQSGVPHSGQFDPTAVAVQHPEAFPSWREEHLPTGGELLIYGAPYVERTGTKYLIEAGAPHEQVERVLHGLVLSLGIALPVIVAIAIGGGYVFMRNALKPLDEVATTAERITSRNLNERVPISPTGDELEKLSVSLNRMMARLEESLHHINRFSADASHEIRTPLAIIRGELEDAFQSPHVSPELKQTIGSALEETERLSRIVEQLLEMSRLEAGEALFERSRFDFAELTKATVDQLRPLAEDKKLKLSVDVGNPVEIEADPIRVKQIVVNLVDNAIKYTSAEGSISVSTFPGGGMAILEVADTGIGIPEEAMSQVFDRFYRVDKGRSRQLGGTGLGLAIVKSICAAYGGTVTVKSAEGQGAVFRVELPLSSS